MLINLEGLFKEQAFEAGVHAWTDNSLAKYQELTHTYRDTNKRNLVVIKRIR